MVTIQCLKVNVMPESECESRVPVNGATAVSHRLVMGQGAKKFKIHSIWQAGIPYNSRAS